MLLYTPCRTFVPFSNHILFSLQRQPLSQVIFFSLYTTHRHTDTGVCNSKQYSLVEHGLTSYLLNYIKGNVLTFLQPVF